MRLECNLPLLRSGNFFFDLGFLGGQVAGYWEPRIEPAFKCKISADEIIERMDDIRKKLEGLQQDSVQLGSVKVKESGL